MLFFFCRQIAKLFHSQLEKAEAPQLFILLISNHGPNVSNVLWWCWDLHRWRREVVIKLTSQIKISTSPSACCSRSLFYICLLFLHSLLSPHSFFALSSLLFLFYFFPLVSSCFLFFPLSFLFPYLSFLYLFVLFFCFISSPFLALPFSSLVIFPFPLLFRVFFSHFVSLHLITFPFFVAFWSLVSPYLLFFFCFLSICLFVSCPCSFFAYIFYFPFLFLFPFSYLVSLCLI